MYERGKLVYKCRNCSKKWTPVGVPDSLKTIIGILHDETEWKGYMYSIHNCKDGSMGVADFIAVQPDED